MIVSSMAVFASPCSLRLVVDGCASRPMPMIAWKVPVCSPGASGDGGGDGSPGGGRGGIGG